ncbi:MAG: SLBB domain-containing protein [Spirochaetaceae bacterium]|jgi:protein involved in polysaccharide export with SLBB domain|nr:SLBB domain-containing protein [Spirochaetaceae bacterium]
MRTNGIILILLWAIAYSLAAQTNTATSQNETQSVDILTPDPQLALSTPDYRVTAGDIYTLTYAAGTTSVDYTITVDSTYRIRVSNLGIVDGTGKTYNQLKTQVETIVSNNYPLGGAQFVLKQPATFRVHIRGEVKTAKEASAWALTRLSTLLQVSRLRGISATESTTYLTLYSSIRNVSVRSSNGQVRVYDLFKAERMGDLSQDPYLRPDDIITVHRMERRVTITGQIERPGTYQLLRGENLKELIEFYGNGFTELADPTRMQVTRYIDATSKSGEIIRITEEDIAKNYELRFYDSVSVPTITEMRPVLFVEGSVQTSTPESGEQVSPEAATRVVVPFIHGEYYGPLIRRNRNWFSAVSDTQNAYIIRGDERIPLNLNPMLYDENFRGEFLIVENDTLIIPFRQYFVTVAGAVTSPGRFPYIPDRTWDYYIALAGGLLPTRNMFQSLDIVDIRGKKLAKTDAITPETIITAKSNHPLYYINQASPIISVVATVTSLVMTFITLSNMLK